MKLFGAILASFALVSADQCNDRCAKMARDEQWKCVQSVNFYTFYLTPMLAGEISLTLSDDLCEQHLVLISPFTEILTWSDLK